MALAEAPEVLDAGAEPRRELRLAYRPGDEVVLRIAQDLVIDQVEGDRAQQLDSPPIVQVVALRVASVDEDEIVLETTVRSATVEAAGTALDADQAAALQAQLDGLAGVGGEVRLDPLGRVLAAELDRPDDLPDEVGRVLDALGAQLGQLSPRLPEEPVGPGARWRTEVPLVELGADPITGTTVQTTTLTAVDGEQLTLSVALVLERDEGAVERDDGTILRDLALTGSGTAVIGLDRPTQRSELRTRSSATLEVPGDSGSRTVEQRTMTVSRVGPQEG
ncbi:MAG: hypothetical protein R2702_05575 [Acidimicrobiales bacterium]